MNIAEGIQLFFAALASLLLRKVLQFLEVKKSELLLTEQSLWLKEIVGGVEQLYGTGQGNLKLERVQQLLEEHAKTHGWRLTPEEARLLIEEQVALLSAEASQ